MLTFRVEISNGSQAVVFSTRGVIIYVIAVLILVAVAAKAGLAWLGGYPRRVLAICIGFTGICLALLGLL